MIRTALVLCIVVATVSLAAFSQQQDDFPVGVFLFGRNNVDCGQMKDSLPLTWLQTWTGFGSYHEPIDTNSAGLKVISMRQGILDVTRSQHMIYEAEEHTPTPDNEGLRNYFGTRPDSVSADFPANSPDSRRSEVGIHKPGYMVRHPRPNNDFHYEQTSYYAKFNMKITKVPGQPEDTVAILKVISYTGATVYEVDSLVLLDGGFASSDTFYEFKLQFNIAVCPNSSPNDTMMYLAGRVSVRASSLECDSVDVLVDWRGYRTTWVNHVTIDDKAADKLFAHTNDALIEQEVYYYLHDPRFNLMQRLYTMDEPFVPAFLSYNYVDAKLHDLGFAGSRGRAIVANYWANNQIKRFIQDGQPNEVFVDPYFINVSVPSPSMTDAEADGVGVPRYTTNSDYNNALQIRLGLLEDHIEPVALHAKDANIPMWQIPQLHGIYQESNGHYYGLRPPTGTEIQAQINIGIAMGSKGVISYPFGTDNYYTAFDEVGSWGTGLVSRNAVNGLYTDHSKDTAWLPYPGASNGRAAFTGYKEKWDSLVSINSKLQVLGPTLKNLTWQGAKSWWSDSTYGNWQGKISLVGTQSLDNSFDAPAVLTGHMTDGMNDYLYIVNRRCDNGRQDSTSIDIRRINFTIPRTDNWLLTEVLTNRSWVSNSTTTIADTFMPGEGKLYRLTSANISGAIVFPQLKFKNGGVLTLASDANITAHGNMDTVNVVLGSNAIFKADTGSTMVIARDSAFVFGSGSQSEIAGFLRTTYGNHTTIPSGATLKLQPDAVLQWGTYGKLVIEGTLSAIGTPDDPIIITKAPGELEPGGVYLSSGSVDTLQYCRFTDLYTAVAINFCNARICNNEFTNCTVAISSDAYKQSPVIEDNTIDSCWIGLDVFTSSIIGVPLIQRNTIMASTYGIIINSSYKSILNDNHVFNGHTGILVSNASPVLHGNVVENSDSIGVLVIENADPRFGDYIKNDHGNNIIRYNGAVQAYSVNADPFFGLLDESEYGGYNSIYALEYTPGVPNVVAQEGYKIAANLNWWGTYPPNSWQFLADSLSRIDYSNALHYDPNEGMRSSVMVAMNETTKPSNPSVVSVTSEDIQLKRALVLRGERNYADAITIYSNLITTKPNAREAQIAVSELRNTYHDYLRWSGDTTLQTALENYLRAQLLNHPSGVIKRIAKILRAAEINNRQDYATAVEQYQQLLLSATLDEERKMFLFSLFNINVNGLRNRTDAQEYLSQMQSQFPNDVRTGIAAIRFAGMDNRSNGNGLGRSSLAGHTEPSQLPMQFSLSQNYPNPFNPLTTIKYDLPSDEQVTLKVYDILGREVHTLVNDFVKAGYQQVSFDASQFSSGVYFYRLQAGTYSIVKKLMLLK